MAMICGIGSVIAVFAVASILLLLELSGLSTCMWKAIGSMGCLCVLSGSSCFGLRNGNVRNV